MSDKQLENRELVGVGRTAEIYAWGEGRVLRLFRDFATETWARRELRVSRIVSDAQVPAPEVFPADNEDGLLRIAGRLGFVMERVDGPSMLEVLTKQPWRLFSFARAMAAFHLSMHRQHAPELPSQRQKFEKITEWIREPLGDGIAERIRDALDQLPDGDYICHGDYHPDNILLGQRGATIIDWGPASAGAPAADVAWTVHLFKHAGYPPNLGRWQRWMFFLFRRLFFAMYRRAYARRASFPWSRVEDWEPVIAAIRYNDQIPEEKEFLERYLKDVFGSTAR